MNTHSKMLENVRGKMLLFIYLFLFLQQMLVSTATLKITSVLGHKTKQISLTGLGNQVQQLHPQLDPLWTTQKALVSNYFECTYFIHK